MALSISVDAAEDMATALASSIGSNSVIEIRSGSKPATPETTASGTLLVTVPISGSFSASGGSITSADPAPANPTTGGTAGYFRLKTSGGTAILDGTVTAVGSGGDMQLGSTTIVTGVSVDLGTVTFTVPVS